MTRNVMIKEQGNSHPYILVGYPMKAEPGSHTEYSGVFILKI